jgi:hypothetical protein
MGYNIKYILINIYYLMDKYVRGYSLTGKTMILHIINLGSIPNNSKDLNS